MTNFTSRVISDITHVSETRRIGLRLAETLQLNEAQLGSIAILITELATNLVRHAKTGQILLKASTQFGFEIFAMDKGPGMNLSRCMEDGYSTGGTAGNGMGAIRRLSTVFDAYSSIPTGSVIYSRLFQLASQNDFDDNKIEVGAISLPYPGEIECGDSWCVDLSNNNLRILVADGLGHGPEAALAAEASVAVFMKSKADSPKIVVEKSHQALCRTRGAAMATGKIASKSNSFSFAGVGNIGATLLSSSESRGLMSHNGTVGVRMRTVQEMEYVWPQGWLLVMHSDGLISRWDLSSYPGLLARHPAVIAGVLIRDFIRGRDDTTVVVVRKR